MPEVSAGRNLRAGLDQPSTTVAGPVSTAAGRLPVGTVGSPREKRKADKAARRVHGFTGVINDLRVLWLDVTLILLTLLKVFHVL